MKNKIFEVFVCMLLIGAFFVVAIDTVSAIDLVEGDYTYTVSNGEAIITGYIGAGGAITIPSTVGGYPVVHIENNAFSGKASLISIIIPDSVTTIGSWAFSLCSFLTSVIIPDSVTTIGDSAFSDTHLTSVTIPRSVITIEMGAFQPCTSLTAIEVDEANVNYASNNSVLYNKDMTTLIQFPGGKAGAFAIPSGVTTIGVGAFHSCGSLTSISIPDSVTNIDGGAFVSCVALTSVIIPNSVTRVGGGAFEACLSLTTVTIGSSVMEIGDWAFLNCSVLTSLKFLGLIAPIGIGENWILNTHVDIRGHAYSNSNFPPPGEKFNGLTMGAVIGSENKPPVAGFTWTPSTPTINQTITFDASASNDSDGSLTLFEWDWNNDGTYEDSHTTPTATHLWTQAGNYTVTVLVMDNDGVTNTKTITIPVSSSSENGETNGNGDTDNKGTPGFELILVIGAIAVAMFLRRKKLV